MEEDYIVYLMSECSNFNFFGKEAEDIASYRSHATVCSFVKEYKEKRELITKTQKFRAKGIN